MTRTSPSRRFVLLGSGLGLGAAMVGIRRVTDAFADGPDDELRFVHVYMNGGWDVLLGPDPRDPSVTYAGLDPGTSRLAAEFQTPLPVTLGATQRVNASLSSIASGSNQRPSYSRRPRRRPSTKY